MMRKFLVQTVLILFLVLGTVFFLFSRVDGYSDNFYMRFTTPKSSSIILGTSRAAQCLQPAVLNKELNRTDFFNYAFTVVISPYGPVYLKSIEKKLDKNTTNGIFILAVDPWSLCSVTQDPNNVDKFRERRKALHKQTFVNMNPNFEYLIRNYHKRFLDRRLVQKEIFLHTDGWLEITIPMDQESIDKRTKKKIDTYRNEYLPKYKFSEQRLSSLEETIDLLNQHGEVYLVRLPVGGEMFKIDDELMPDFNQKISELSKDKHIRFLDLSDSNDDYIYTDGNHISSASGKEVSKVVSQWILKVQGE